MPGTMEIARFKNNGFSEIYGTAKHLPGTDDIEHTFTATLGRNGERAARL